LRSRPGGVIGVVNGIDASLWNTKTDSFIEKQYDVDTYCDGKAENKIALQRRVNLPLVKDVPLLGFVGRISHQKGIDLMMDALKGVLALDCQVVIQGVGDKGYERRLKDVAAKNSDRLAVLTEFDEKLAHQIYAGSDFFLMPSVFEPCGLSQLISMKYGSVPIAFATGGLVDTVVSYEAGSTTATGFLFREYSVSSFLKVLGEAVAVFKDRRILTQIIERGMRADFAWDSSARKYQEIYQCLLSD